MKRFVAMLAFVSLLWTGFFGTEKANAAEIEKHQVTTVANVAAKTTNQAKKPVLTLKYLADVWVNEKGFVCSYDEEYFYYGFDTILNDCNVTKTGVQGSNIMLMEEQIVNVKIEVIDQNSIKVNGVTAYRSSSTKAKGYLAKIKEVIQGDWILADNFGYLEIPVTITKNELKFPDQETQKVEASPYKFEGCAIVMANEGLKDTVMKLQMLDLDCIAVSDVLSTAKFYRKDSKAYEKYQSTKDNFLVGSWIYASSDRTKSEKWEVTKDKITCTAFTKNAKAKVVSYELKRENNGISLIVGDKTYRISPLFNMITLYGDDNESASLLDYDSNEGKHELKNIKVANKNGKNEKRSYTSTVPDDFIKKAKLTMTCKNNIVLEDEITFGSFDNELVHKSCLACLLTSANVKYKNASITISYDAKKLNKVKESKRK